MLEAALDDLPRIGGSHAQREVVEDLLIVALLRSAQSAKAAQLLRSRLDRRPSGRDQEWLAVCSSSPTEGQNPAIRPLSAQLLQLVDKAGNHGEALRPEGGVGGVEPERGQQFAMPQSAPAPKIPGTSRRNLDGRPVGGVERVHQAISESIGIDVKRRMDEVRNIAPVKLIGWFEQQCRAEALALYVEPDLAETVGGQLGLAALVMDLDLECRRRRSAARPYSACPRPWRRA